jgi:hypothetical protein
MVGVRAPECSPAAALHGRGAERQHREAKAMAEGGLYFSVLEHQGMQEQGRTNKVLFYDVMDISSLQKDGDGIATMLLDVAMQATANNPKSLIGFVLYNTKTNHKAMHVLF